MAQSICSGYLLMLFVRGCDDSGFSDFKRGLTVSGLRRAIFAVFDFLIFSIYYTIVIGNLLLLMIQPTARNHVLLIRDTSFFNLEIFPSITLFPEASSKAIKRAWLYSVLSAL